MFLAPFLTFWELLTSTDNLLERLKLRERFSKSSSVIWKLTATWLILTKTWSFKPNQLVLSRNSIRTFPRIYLKGKIPKILSLSAHHYADGRTGEVLESTKHVWSSRGKQCCSQIQYWSEWWPLHQKEKHNAKKQIEFLHTAPVVSSKCP